MRDRAVEHLADDQRLGRALLEPAHVEQAGRVDLPAVDVGHPGHRHEDPAASEHLGDHARAPGAGDLGAQRHHEVADLAHLVALGVEDRQPDEAGRVDARGRGAHGRTLPAVSRPTPEAGDPPCGVESATLLGWPLAGAGWWLRSRELDLDRTPAQSTEGFNHMTKDGRRALRRTRPKAVAVGVLALGFTFLVVAGATGIVGAPSRGRRQQLPGHARRPVPGTPSSATPRRPLT